MEEQNLEEVVVEEDLTPKHQKLNKSLFRKLLSIIISSLLYFIIKSLKRNENLSMIKTEFENSILNNVMIAFYVISFISIILVIVYFILKKKNNKFDNMELTKKKRMVDIVDFLSIFPISIVIVSFCFNFLFFVANVDGQSMEYTIIDQQKAFVSYITPVDQFDIVVVYVNPLDNRLPSDNDDYYIKRVIGMPGDKVDWANGILKINGVKVEETYLSDETISHNETDYSQSHDFFYIDENGQKVVCDTIPEGYYFVMGDNRRISRDSRSIGLIPEDNVVGVVKFFFGKGDK